MVNRHRVRQLFLAAAMLVGVGSLGAAVYPGGPFAYATTGRAARLLVQLEQRAALPTRQQGSIQQTGPDGPMPEIAGRELMIDGKAEEIAERVRKACRQLGIELATKERLATEPDALCAGERYQSGNSVHLTHSCDTLCRVYLQIQVIGFEEPKMTGRADILPNGKNWGRLSYTRRCGWVDWARVAGKRDRS